MTSNNTNKRNGEFGRDEIDALLGGGLAERLLRPSSHNKNRTTSSFAAATTNDRNNKNRDGKIKDVSDMTVEETAAMILDEQTRKKEQMSGGGSGRLRAASHRPRQYHALLEEELVVSQKQQHQQQQQQQPMVPTLLLQSETRTKITALDTLTTATQHPHSQHDPSSTNHQLHLQQEYREDFVPARRFRVKRAPVVLVAAAASATNIRATKVDHLHRRQSQDTNQKNSANHDDNDSSSASSSVNRQNHHRRHRRQRASSSTGSSSSSSSSDDSGAHRRRARFHEKQQQQQQHTREQLQPPVVVQREEGANSASPAVPDDDDKNGSTTRVEQEGGDSTIALKGESEASVVGDVSIQPSASGKRQGQQQQGTSNGSDTSVDESSSEDSSSSSSSSEEDEEDESLAMIRPKFVSKHKRGLIVSVEAEAAMEQIKEKKFQEQEARRKQESRAMVQQMLVAAKREFNDTSTESSSNFQNVPGATLENVPDDKDEDADAAIAKDEWEVRELERLLHDWDLENQRLVDDRDRALRRRMTKRTKEQDNDDQHPEKSERRQRSDDQNHDGQKFFHRGAFFMDESEWDESDVRHNAIDYSHAATGESHRDRRQLPKVMQVKRFGFANQSKYKGLAAEDTTDKQMDMLPLPRKK